MAAFNRGDTRTPAHLRERAQRLRDQALSASDEEAARLRRQAQDLEDEARKSSRIRG